MCVSKARGSVVVKAACQCGVGYPLLEDGKTCAPGKYCDRALSRTQSALSCSVCE